MILIKIIIYKQDSITQYKKSLEMLMDQINEEEIKLEKKKKLKMAETLDLLALTYKEQ